MSSYNSSTARQIDSYENYTMPVQATPKKAELKVVKRKKSRGALAFVNLSTVLVFLAVVSCVCIMLYNHVVINEINGEIKSVENEITQLESEYVRLKSGLESNLSLRTVARQAEQELGLQRIDQYQVEYVIIYEEDTVEIIENNDPVGFSEKVETFAARIVKSIKGFFGDTND